MDVTVFVTVLACAVVVTVEVFCTVVVVATVETTVVVVAAWEAAVYMRGVRFEGKCQKYGKGRTRDVVAVVLDVVALVLAAGMGLACTALSAASMNMPGTKSLVYISRDR